MRDILLPILLPLYLIMVAFLVSGKQALGEAGKLSRFQHRFRAKESRKEGGSKTKTKLLGEE